MEEQLVKGKGEGEGEKDEGEESEGEKKVKKKTKRKARKKKKKAKKVKKKTEPKKPPPPKKPKVKVLLVEKIDEAKYSSIEDGSKTVDWAPFNLSDPDQEAALDHYLKRHTAYGETYKKFFRILIANGSIDLSMIEHFPLPIRTSGMTVFDQIYEVCMAVAFPPYRKSIREGLFGVEAEDKIDTKLWRCLFPPKFGIHQVLIRAESYQQAFGLACDYACRLSMQMYHQIPKDLTIRVLRASHKSVKYMLKMRHANRKVKLNQRGFTCKSVYTPKQVTGAKLPAIGHPKQPEYRIFRDIELDQWEQIYERIRAARVSRVESESFTKMVPHELIEYRDSLGKPPQKESKSDSSE